MVLCSKADGSAAEVGGSVVKNIDPYPLITGKICDYILTFIIMYY